MIKLVFVSTRALAASFKIRMYPGIALRMQWQGFLVKWVHHYQVPPYRRFW